MRSLSSLRTNVFAVIVGLSIGVVHATLAHASKAPPPHPPRSTFPYTIFEHQLDNGLRTVVVPTGARGFVAVYSVVGTGSRDEVEPGHSGFAHFFEHMMFKGTQKFPADKRTALLASLGVDESGYTTDDFTTYHMQGPSSALPTLLELEGDRFQNLSFTEAEFKTESRAVLGEYNKNASDPDEKGYEALADLAFDTHTYKHTTIGFLADIERMPNEYAYAQQFFRRFYTPDNVLLFVVGDVEPAAVNALVGQHFGAWRGRRTPTMVRDEPALSRERRRVVPWASPTLDRLHVGWRVPSGVKDPKAGALALLLNGYAFSESSALHQQLVLNDRIAEDIHGWFDIHRDASLFPVVVRATAEHRGEDALDPLQRVLDVIGKGEIDVARFDAVRAHLKYDMLMNLTSADRIAGLLAYHAGPGMNVHSIEQTFDALNALTPNDLATFVRTWFRPEQRAVVVVRHAPSGSPS